MVSSFKARHGAIAPFVIASYWIAETGSEQNRGEKEWEFSNRGVLNGLAEREGGRETFWKTNRFPGGHSHKGQCLTAFDKEGGVGWANDLELNPESNATPFGDTPLDPENVAELCRPLVIDLGATHHGVNPRALDFREVHSHLNRQKGAGGFYETQVHDVVHDTPGVGIEIHDSHICGYAAIIGHGGLLHEGCSRVF